MTTGLRFKPWTDATNADSRQGTDILGIEGVDELAKRSLTAPTLYAMGEAVLAGAREFAGGQLQDDACLVLVRRE